ncbi:hypothetical protein [Pectobacterium versatile]|uniref:hypothetical protein n=1 Tax=Pectobacterium versatile TaxID=2488639 RepID=UPI001B3928F5|nr:hypothetical protein [Pectobacterium versatile]MBQ4777672.1 hypothetical protein [Pectobacterium versatile]
MTNLTNERLEEMRHYGADIAEIIDRLFVAEKRLAETQQSYKVACALHTKSAQALAALEKQEPDLYLCPVTRDGEKLFSQCGRDYPRGRGYYSRPAPQAVIQPVKPIGFIEAKSQGTDTYTLKCFYRPSGASELLGQEVYASQPASQLERDVSAVVGLLEDQEWAEHCAIRTELGRRLENAITELHNQLGEASQPYTVPDEWTYNDAVQFVLINGMSNETRAGIAMHVFNHCRAAMLQSGNSPVWSGVDKVNSPVIPDGSVPEGYAVAPGTIYLDESDIESICSQCGDGGGNYGDFTRGILWVGDIQDDEGNITHGLHISSDDYPEEGGITLAKFSAAPQHKGE